MGMTTKVLIVNVGHRDLKLTAWSDDRVLHVGEHAEITIWEEKTLLITEVPNVRPAVQSGS